MNDERGRTRVTRRVAVETLEDRLAMSADPIVNLGDELWQQANSLSSNESYAAHSATEVSGSASLGGALSGVDSSQFDTRVTQHRFLEPETGPSTTETTSSGDDLVATHDDLVRVRVPDFWIDRSLEYESSLVERNDHQLEQFLSAAHEQSGLDIVWDEYGLRGAGQTVAVIDSGIAWDHTALGGGFGSSYRVVGGWDFTEGDADPYDDGPEGSHGTHVAGIVGADSDVGSGVASAVDLVGLRVFNDAGGGYFSWVESALQWVHEHKDAFDNPITTVNLSLGTDWNSDSVPAWAMLEDEFATLAEDGIFIAVSAGNSFASFNSPGLSYPAASPHVVPVMATDDNGQLSYFSQRAEGAIAAPGRTISSTVPDYVGNGNGVADDYASYSGTSMASPYVAGAAVLVRQAMEIFDPTIVVDQSVVYDHLMTTADSVYDATTRTSYKRLNLDEAISTLEPDDDYGETASTAVQLGALSGGTQIAGLIGNLNDVDYFSFTAASSGRLTLSATESGPLDVDWHGAEGDVHENGDVFVLDVIAGESYTVGLSTSAGIGRYEIAVAGSGGDSGGDGAGNGSGSDDQVGGGADTTPPGNGDADSDPGRGEEGGAESQPVAPPEEWGRVDYRGSESIDVDRIAEYRITASRTGYLTAIVKSASSLHVSLHDGSGNVIAASGTGSGLERVDGFVASGEAYILRIEGSGAAEVEVANLVAVDAGKLTVSGTAAADRFEYESGAIERVTVNGISYAHVGRTIDEIVIDGGGGSDHLRVTGSQNAEQFTLRPDQFKMSGEGVVARATRITAFEVDGGGGTDIAHLYDTSGDEHLVTRPEEVVLQGSDYQITASHMTKTYTFSSGGADRVDFYDSSGDDLYRAWSDRAVLSGDTFYNYAAGFSSTYAFASSGDDWTNFYDSAGDDLYRSWHDRVVMSGTDYYNFATGFDRTYAYASSGEDRVYSYDSSGDDLYRGWHDRVVMSGDEFYNYAQGFDRTYAYATEGSDLAQMYDSDGNDYYRAWADRVVMSGGGFYNYAQGFATTYATATAGTDTATFYDSAGHDLYRAWANRAVMDGSGFANHARGFDATVAFASEGYDRAVLHDSSGDDWLVVAAGGVSLTGSEVSHQVSNFNSVTASSENGGTDEVEVDSVDYLFSLLGDWQEKE